jgi:hypothetical protein
MNHRPDASQRSLRRLLANGRLTALPKRPSDQVLLATLAVSRMDPDRTLTEAEVNEALVAWLDDVSEPYGIDHVTMRRLIVDSRLLNRTPSGSTYVVNDAKRGEIDAVRELNPAEVLAGIVDERDQRKRQHAA